MLPSRWGNRQRAPASSALRCERRVPPEPYPLGSTSCAFSRPLPNIISFRVRSGSSARPGSLTPAQRAPACNDKREDEQQEPPAGTVRSIYSPNRCIWFLARAPTRKPAPAAPARARARAPAPGFVGVVRCDGLRLLREGYAAQTRPAVVIGNAQLSCTVLTGGGHIALVQRTDSPISTDDAGEDYGSPLYLQPMTSRCPTSYLKLREPARTDKNLRWSASSLRPCTACETHPLISDCSNMGAGGSHRGRHVTQRLRSSPILRFSAMDSRVTTCYRISWATTSGCFWLQHRRRGRASDAWLGRPPPMFGMHGEAGACTWQVIHCESSDAGASVAGSTCAARA